jgi:hypothetical protein
MTMSGPVLVSRKTKPVPIEQQIQKLLVEFADSGFEVAEVTGLAIGELAKLEKAIQELGLGDVEVYRMDGRIFLARKLSK